MRSLPAVLGSFISLNAQKLRQVLHVDERAHPTIVENVSDLEDHCLGSCLLDTIGVCLHADLKGAGKVALLLFHLHDIDQTFTFF